MNHLSLRVFLTGVTFTILMLILTGWSGVQRAVAASPVCGNGVIEFGEECDDGNLIDGDGCSSACTVEGGCYDGGNTFSFFTFSDANTGSGEGGVIRVLTDAVNRSKYPSRVIPRFWVSSGDIPFMAEGSDMLDQLNDEISNSPAGQNYPFACSASNGRFPYFVALGNHDVDGYVNMTPQAQYDYWKNYVGPLLPSTLVGIMNFRWGPDSVYDGRTTYSFDYKNAHFIIVNQYHGDPTYPTVDPKGCIRQDLLNWIEQDLSGTERPVRFVFGHEPAWSYCSTTPGCGGEYCPVGSVDNQNPPRRPRPYSTTGSWPEDFGRHWGDSLEDPACPPGSREAFWSMLARHKVLAHFVGHTHAYSGRLVEGDGTPRNDVSAYNKGGASFDSSEGVWEINNSETHNSAGSGYVLTTVRNNVVTFEAYDQIGTTEPLKQIESWSVRLGPVVEITSPAAGATFKEPAEITITAEASEPNGAVTTVAFYAGSTLVGTATTSPCTVTWSPVPAGTYRLTAVATDNAGSWTISDAVNVTVYPSSGNNPPLLTPIGDKVVPEETLLTFTASAMDPDPGDILTFSLVKPPAGATINPSTGLFTWTPTEAQGPGIYRFTVRVTDSGSPALSADDLIEVTVTEVNRPPVLSGIGDKSVLERTKLTFIASATDPDIPVNGLTFSLVNAPAGAGIDAVNGVFTWTPTSAQVGAYSFAVRVTDNGSPPLSDNKTITVTVNSNVDLVMKSVSTTITGAAPGSSFTVSNTPWNKGGASSNAFVIGFHLSSDAVYGGSDDIAFSQTRSVTSLGAGASSTASTTVTVPSATPPGDYYICVWADINNTVKEKDEINNGLCTTSTIRIGYPDLILAQVQPGASSVIQGGKLQVTDTLRNQGTVSAGSSTIAYRLSLNRTYGDADDVIISTTRTVNSLAAGTSSAATTSLTVPTATTPGSYYLCAKADSTGTVKETDETNNTLCSDSLVTVPPPDLIMSALSTTATAVNRGGSLTVSNTVANQGGAAAGSFTITFHLSQDATYGGTDDIAFSRTRTVTSLKPGVSSTASTSLTVPSVTPPGSYYICGYSDSGGTVAEGDEANNARCTGVTVQVN
jgi:cysteine-rich repeat protein